MTKSIEKHILGDTIIAINMAYNCIDDLEIVECFDFVKVLLKKGKMYDKNDFCRRCFSPYRTYIDYFIFVFD